MSACELVKMWIGFVIYLSRYGTLIPKCFHSICVFYIILQTHISHSLPCCSTWKHWQMCEWHIVHYHSSNFLKKGNLPESYGGTHLRRDASLANHRCGQPCCLSTVKPLTELALCCCFIHSAMLTPPPPPRGVRALRPLGSISTFSFSGSAR